MKNANDANEHIRVSIDILARQYGCSREEAKARAGILLAADTANVAEPPAEPALTLSARTRQIMAEKKVPFAQAQSEASRAFRRQIVRGGR